MAEIGLINCRLLLIAGSAGSLEALLELLPALSRPVHFAILLVMHRGNSPENVLAHLLSGRTMIPVREIEDKDQIIPGVIYLSPADYHLLVEQDQSFALDSSEKINFSRPCIDLAFESAAAVYKERLVGLLLSGANSDGTKGLMKVADYGGITCVQEPATATVQFMPQHAIEHLKPDFIIPLHELAGFINSLEKGSQ
jgi:two-component system, chemotaxis family, protein-glutamate methylesterase/glutaminase